jgi:hypothetical protein
VKKPPKGVKRLMKSKKAGKNKPAKKTKTPPTKTSSMIARAMAPPDDGDADDVGDHEYR